MCIKQKSDFVKIYDILVILTDFYVSLSRLFLLPGSGSTFPELDPDPAK